MSDIQIIEIEPKVIEVLEIASVIVQNTDVLPADRIVPFAFDEWVYENGYYYADIAHYLESAELFVSVREGNIEKWVDRWESITSNKIRLYIPAEPDSRFAGKCFIRKMSGAM